MVEKEVQAVLIADLRKATLGEVMAEIRVFTEQIPKVNPSSYLRFEKWLTTSKLAKNR